MQDVKQQLGLGGDHNWPHMPIVKIQGDPSARTWKTGAQGGVIESWHTVAVLRVVSRYNERFKVGFKNGNNMQNLNHIIESKNGPFGMRIGDGDVEFFVIPDDAWSASPQKLSLEVIELTTEDDPAYADLPLY